MEAYDDIFLKMDIEGHEIPWFLSLDSKHMDNMSQMVVEFHFPFSPLETIVFDKIIRTHILIHFHNNNNCGVRAASMRTTWYPMCLSAPTSTRSISRLNPS